jgi:large subunit ribosomal protein L6
MVSKTSKKSVVARIGSKPVVVSDNIEFSLGDENVVSVTGPLGSLTQQFTMDVLIKYADNLVRIERLSDIRKHRALQGLTRALIQNMVTGVSEGFSKSLDIVGVGYRAEKVDNGLNLLLGFSHRIVFTPPEGISLVAESPTRIIVSGVDRQKVGQVAADIRRIRPPEPYKGKGIRYSGEQVRLKPGKSAARK